MEERLRVKLGCVGDTVVAVPLPRGAGTITSLSRADGIIRIPRDSEGCNTGEPVTVELLRPATALAGALLAIGSHDNTLDLLDSMPISVAVLIGMENIPSCANVFTSSYPKTGLRRYLQTDKPV